MSNPPSGEYLSESISSKSEMKVKGLPDGWKREVVIRKNGQSAGKTDVYYYSPCGKKFRSKPQIARFLGESVDLSAFDFSRGALPGGVSSQRRARDRTARRAMDVGKFGTTLIKPLSNNPLGASGPIRRTCGVIKLPVTWIPTPKREKVVVAAVKAAEPEPMDTSDSTSTATPPPPSSCRPSEESPLPVGNGGSVEQSKSQQQTTTKPQEQSTTKPAHLPFSPLPATTPAAANAEGNQSTPPTSSSSSTTGPSSSTTSSSSSSSSSASSSQHIFPCLWENRLRGFVVHDHETKTEIKVDLERLQNGIVHASAASNSDTNSTDKTASPGGIKIASGTGSRGSGGTSETKPIKSTISSTPPPPTKTLLNNLLGKHHHMTNTGNTGNTTPPSNRIIGSIIPSLLAHGIKAHQKQSTGAATASLPTTPRSRKENSSMMKATSTSMANIVCQQQNRSNLSAGGIVLSLPGTTQGAIKMLKQAATSCSAESNTASFTTQKQSVRTTGPILTAAKMTHGGSGIRPTSGSSAEAGNQGVFVSKSELVLQEERVRRLREQLMAAQSTV